MTVQDIHDWVNQIIAGNITEHLRSEPSNYHEFKPFKKLIGTNYHEITQDPTKDVLVMIHDYNQLESINQM